MENTPMAHVRTAHCVSLYIAGKSQPELPNDRLVKLGWKSNEKEGRKAHSARCFSVPMWQPNLSGPDVAFLPMLIETVEDWQDKTAHTYVTMMLAENDGVCNDIPADLLDPRNILAAFMEEQEKSTERQRLSGDQIKAWYNENLSELVQLRVIETKGWTEPSAEQVKQAEQAANQYRAVLEKLAAPSPSVTIDTAKAVQTALRLYGADNIARDSVASKLEAKLERIINPPANKGSEAVLAML
jgi:hypothetical protein